MDDKKEHTIHELAYQNKIPDNRSEERKQLAAETREFYIKKNLRPRYGRRIYR